MDDYDFLIRVTINTNFHVIHPENEFDLMNGFLLVFRSIRKVVARYYYYQPRNMNNNKAQQYGINNDELKEGMAQWAK